MFNKMVPFALPSIRRRFTEISSVDGPLRTTSTVAVPSDSCTVESCMLILIVIPVENMIFHAHKVNLGAHKMALSLVLDLVLICLVCVSKRSARLKITVRLCMYLCK